MDWFTVGNMTLGEVKTCLWAHDKIQKVNDYNLYNVVFTATVNANGGDKNGRALKLHQEIKKPMTREEIKKEMEILGIK